MKSTGRICRLATVLLAAMAMGGCGWFSRDRNAELLTTPGRMSQGLVIVLPGIEGKSELNRGIRDGLADGNVWTGIRIHDWTLGPILAPVSQIWESRARSQGDLLADTIRGYKSRLPGRPVVLVGHSGGCAVAIFALEKLPKDMTITSVVMLGPSISPSYDLSNALGHIDGRAYCYYSSKDVALLGIGTWVFGTLDGKHTASAGQTGFSPPQHATQLYRRKLMQIGWNPGMELSGNSGGHIDWARQKFVRDYIATRVKDELRSHQGRAMDDVPRPRTQPEPQPQQLP